VLDLGQLAFVLGTTEVFKVIGTGQDPQGETGTGGGYLADLPELQSTHKGDKIRCMKRSKLDRPHIKLQIAYRIASGCSQRQIAEMLGTSQPAIFRMVHLDEVQEMILQEEARLLESGKKAVEEVSNSPQFLAKLNAKIEQMLLDFKL
jgi:DNA-binding MarR family transcriptional regulator